MYPTFKDEYDSLVDLTKFKNYRRYGKSLYVKESPESDNWKPEYNLAEFAWGFCKSPCYAKRLVDTLETNLPDHKKFLKVLSRANNNITPNKVFSQWESAVSAIVKENSSNPMVLYSTESNHVWKNKTLYCNDVDGELWHGMLIPPDVLMGLETISVTLTGKDFDNEPWATEYFWNAKDVKTMCVQFNSIEPQFYFSPFKHPLILLNGGLSVKVDLTFVDGCIPNESNVKMVYGICNTVLQNWLNDIDSFTSETAFDQKLVMKGDRCVEQPITKSN